jgi:hypothetical protein
VLTLTVSHNIFLSKEQRYALSEPGQVVEVVGVSVPVWFLSGKTSEPAKEVFSLYKLVISDDNKAISKHKHGYLINLPRSLQSISIPIAQILKDSEDGGRGTLQYKEYSNSKRNGKKFNVVHTIEIYDDKDLLDSIT